MKTSNKILIRGVNWLGDAVMSLPAIEAIRCAFPEYEIDVLTKDNLKDLYELYPHVSNVISIDSKKSFRSFYNELKTSFKIKKKSYELAFVFPSSFHSAVIPFLARIPVRIGYKLNARSFLLTNSYDVKADYKRDIHQSKFYMNLIYSFTRKSFSKEVQSLQIPEPLKVSVFKKLESAGYLGGNILGIAPGAEYGPAKKWSNTNWYLFISQVLKETDYSIVITGTASDTVTAEFLKESSRGRVIDMTGKTTLKELFGLISLSDCFVANDSGAMHAASAVGKPVVAIFGSTSPNATSPLVARHTILYKGVPCSPCFERECPKKTYECLGEIEPDQVFDAVKEFI